MKKYIIIFVLIAATITILLQTRKAKIQNQTPSQFQQTSDIKIGKEIQKNETQPPSAYMQQTVSPSYIQITGCTKTFEDIILEYGKEWGPMQVKKLSLSTEETNNIISLINDYLTCSAIANKDFSKCNLFALTQESCINTYYTYQFAEFFVGANKNEQDCKKYVEMLKKNPKNDGMKITSLNITPDNLCYEIKQDLRGLCDRLFSNSSDREKCYEVFPKNILDTCPMRDKNSCIASYETMKKTGEVNCDMFDENKKELCEIRRAGHNRCNDKLQKLLLTYCSYQENIKKKLIEMEEKKKKEEEKIQAEKEKLKKAKEEEERKKLEGEVIKKAKQAAEEAKKFKGRKYEEE
ncbi:MAG: hypothetical protein N2Z20_01420 [Elusimicrobiales bacterium]|nr:hypothetical protein [Elusimicrobiales bacterium]